MCLHCIKPGYLLISVNFYFIVYIKETNESKWIKKNKDLFQIKDFFVYNQNVRNLYYDNVRDDPKQQIFLRVQQSAH